MRLNRHKLLEAIESGVRYALELDDEDYNNEEQVDFNKDKIESKTNREIFQERVQTAFDNKRFFPRIKDMISQFNLTWKPKNKQDLKDTINAYCEYYNDWALNLNFINISDITDMFAMFAESNFNGNISKWDVSNVTDMSYMFNRSKFNGDILKWDVSSVTNMNGMFNESKFNGDISKWDVSNVKTMNNMFAYSEFNGDISKWDVSKVLNMYAMFAESNFNGDISNWNVSNVTDMSYMFNRSKFNGDISNWNVSNVTNMQTMFDGSEFSGDLSNWEINIESVDDIKCMLNSSSQNIIVDPKKIKLYRKIQQYSKTNRISKPGIERISNIVRGLETMYYSWDEKNYPNWLKKLIKQFVD